MMSMNLKDYVKIYEDFIDESTCEVIRNQLDAANWETHSFYNAAQDKFISFEKELSVTNLDSKESKDLQNKMWFSIDKYIRSDFAFMGDWFSGWNGYSQVRYNRYNTGTQMKLHCDHIHSMFDGNRKGIPVLSILGALNDDYEGGELVFWGDQTIELKAGSLMIFPSNFMYPHKVVEVTKGTRYSYVSWVW